MLFASEAENSVPTFLATAYSSSSGTTYGMNLPYMFLFETLFTSYERGSENICIGRRGSKDSSETYYPPDTNNSIIGSYIWVMRTGNSIKMYGSAISLSTDIGTYQPNHHKIKYYWVGIM